MKSNCIVTTMMAACRKDRPKMSVGVVPMLSLPTVSEHASKAALLHDIRQDGEEGASKQRADIVITSMSARFWWNRLETAQLNTGRGELPQGILEQRRSSKVLDDALLRLHVHMDAGVRGSFSMRWLLDLLHTGGDDRGKASLARGQGEFCTYNRYISRLHPLCTCYLGGPGKSPIPR